jgi:hypothetical protein
MNIKNTQILFLLTSWLKTSRANSRRGIRKYNGQTDHCGSEGQKEADPEDETAKLDPGYDDEYPYTMLSLSLCRE